MRKIEGAPEPPRASNGPSHGMESVFLRNCCYSAQVRLWLLPLLCYFGEESFKFCGSDIDEHPNRLIRIIFESVDRSARGVYAIARKYLSPSIERRSKRVQFRRPLFLARRYFHQFWHLRPQSLEIGCFRDRIIRSVFRQTRLGHQGTKGNVRIDHAQDVRNSGRALLSPLLRSGQRAIIRKNLQRRPHMVNGKSVARSE